MLKNRNLKILFRSVIVIAILNLSGFSFAEDACSDNAGAAGLPTIPAEVDSSEDLPTNLTLNSSSETIARNTNLVLSIEIEGYDFRPYQWTVVGSGFHFNDISGPIYEETETPSEVIELWADNTACGSAIITVTNSYQKVATASVRVLNNGGWYLVSDEQCSYWQRSSCAFCTVEDTFTIGGYRYQNIWIGDKACNMTEETCGPYPGGVDLRGNACSVIGYYTNAYANTFFQRKKWEWRCSP